MKPIFMCLMLLCSCAPQQIYRSNEQLLYDAQANCHGNIIGLPSDDFYNKKTRTVANTRPFYACMQGQNIAFDLKSVLSMQESLWIQVIQKTKTPAQAKQEYLAFIQPMIDNAKALNTQNQAIAASQSAARAARNAESQQERPRQWMENSGGRAYQCNNYGGTVNCN